MWFECRLIPKEVPDSAVVHREQQVHSVIVLHVVAADDYWPLPHCRILPVALFLFPFINFRVFSSRSVTVSMPALNLADQPEARSSRRIEPLLARSFALVPIADTRLARLCAAVRTQNSMFGIRNLREPRELAQPKQRKFAKVLIFQSMWVVLQPHKLM
jgi:hypothetical protein